MQNKDLLLPLLAQVFLTFIVWNILAIGRTVTTLRKRINPQILADETQNLLVFKNLINPSDNLENLFEVPVLFYAAIGLILTLNVNDSFYVAAAWFFVAGRFMHSFIHCTYNKIKHRFYVYILSSWILWVIWARLGWTIVSG